MERLEELYEKLIELVPDDQVDQYMACGCSVGRNYDLMDKRLLVVEKIPKAPHRDEDGCDCGCGCGEHHDHHGEHHHHHHSPLENSNLNSTDFTEAIGKISRHLLNISPNQWPDSIAKTYLYKVAPMEGKASPELLKRQHDLCRDILLEEIRTYDPTHILFLTGWSSVWDFDLPIYPLLKGEMVEAVGMTDNGAQVLVSRYAIRDSEDKFVADIVSAFRSLDENADKDSR